MNGSSIGAFTKDQPAVSARVLRVFLYEFSLLDHGTDITETDHPVRPGHLADGMTQEQYFFACRLPDKLHEIGR